VQIPSINLPHPPRTSRPSHAQIPPAGYFLLQSRDHTCPIEPKRQLSKHPLGRPVPTQHSQGLGVNYTPCLPFHHRRLRLLRTVTPLTSPTTITNHTLNLLNLSSSTGNASNSTSPDRVLNPHLDRRAHREVYLAHSDEPQGSRNSIADSTVPPPRELQNNGAQPLHSRNLCGRSLRRLVKIKTPQHLEPHSASDTNLELYPLPICLTHQHGSLDEQHPQSYTPLKKPYEPHTHLPQI